MAAKRSGKAKGKKAAPKLKDLPMSTKDAKKTKANQVMGGALRRPTIT